MRLWLFVITAAVLGVSYLLSHKIMASRAGRVLRSVRDAESRTQFLGYRTDHYKLALFVYSAIIAALAGIMYVPQVGIINPGEFSPINSIEIVVWVAVGGRGTLYGAVVGALLVNYAKTKFTAFRPDDWLFALGALFVIVTLFMQRGVVGVFEDLIGKFKNKKTIDPNNKDEEQKVAP